MGCCTSREANASPYNGTPARPVPAPATAPDSSRAAINPPTSHTSRSASQHSDTPRASNHTLPNKPLRLPAPVAVCPPERALSPWTKSQLQREREAFFETRVTGNPQVWEALRMICEMLRNEDLEGAQNVLNTVGLTCPTGRVERERPSGGRKGGVFDERGNRYDIPGWVIADPGDVVQDEDELEKEAGTLDGAEDGDDDDTKVFDGDEGDEAKERRDEKGKGKLGEVEDSINVRVRLTDRQNDIVVSVGKAQRVRVLVRRIQEKTGLTSKLRLAYFGKMLSEDKSLADQGFKEGDVLLGFVTGA